MVLVRQVFHNGKLSHFIDGRGNSGNWMAYVNCARYAQEQNLIAVQVCETECDLMHHALVILRLLLQHLSPR